MHPDIVSATPGKCSICGMALVPGDPMATFNYVMKVETEPKVVKAGVKTRFTFNIFHPLTGARITDFATVHDRMYHLFIISRDMTHFVHDHPQPAPSGGWTIEVTLPKPGHYTLLSDFLPLGGSPQVLATPVITAGFEGDLMSSIPKLVPDVEWTKTIDGVKVEMKVQPSLLFSGENVDLPFRFTDEKTDQPITDLERYLGAFAHALILSEDQLDHIHAHPQEMLEGTAVTSGGGPDVIFDAFFPRPGRYRAWVQFQRQGKLSTIAFTVAVPRQGETVPQ